MTAIRLTGPHGATDRRRSGCPHVPPCPSWEDPDHAAARVVAAHLEQGWSLLCNGVIVFADTGEILPSRVSVAPHRPDSHWPVRAA
jgi:hypothetical protein